LCLQVLWGKTFLVPVCLSLSTFFTWLQKWCNINHPSIPWTLGYILNWQLDRLRLNFASKTRKKERNFFWRLFLPKGIIVGARSRCHIQCVLNTLSWFFCNELPKVTKAPTKKLLISIEFAPVYVRWNLMLYSLSEGDSYHQISYVVGRL